MDVPRALVVGGPLAGTATFLALGLATPASAAGLLMPAGLAIAVLVGAYATLRLRGDLALPLALLGLAHAAVFAMMTSRCAGRNCGVLQPVFDAFHVGAFAAALAAPTVLIASAFAPALRPGLRRTVLAVACAVLAFLLLAAGWAARGA